jgi:NADH dehydrogenase [ubiquinone] 1 alpha subcomplex assembly factor 1
MPRSSRTLRSPPAGGVRPGLRALACRVALGVCAMTTVPAQGQPATSPSETGRSAVRTEAAAAWSIVNDGVMGGVSSSRVQPTDDGLRFEGEVRLEFNGGFASMRRAAQWPADSAGVRLRARGDGNAYRLVVYTRDPASGRPRPYAYHAVFSPPADAAGAADPTAIAELHWPRFRASFRGRAVPDAAPLVAADVIGVGVMITKDEHRAGQGRFVLHLVEIAPLP